MSIDRPKEQYAPFTTEIGSGLSVRAWRVAVSTTTPEILVLTLIQLACRIQIVCRLGRAGMGLKCRLFSSLKSRPDQSSGSLCEEREWYRQHRQEDGMESALIIF